MFFRRLRDLREDHDYTQSQIGELLGIRQTVYSRYERGVQTIPVEHLLCLADLYKTSTDYILGRTDDIGAGRPNADCRQNGSTT